MTGVCLPRNCVFKLLISDSWLAIFSAVVFCNDVYCFVNLFRKSVNLSSEHLFISSQFTHSSHSSHSSHFGHSLGVEYPDPIYLPRRVFLCELFRRFCEAFRRVRRLPPREPTPEYPAIGIN